MSAAKRQFVARCPRCGYDLRGLVATWEDRCPLEGVCSECGLKLRWAEVLVPEKFEPAWCVEFAAGRFAIVRGSIRTLLCSFMPWRFWSSLNMAHGIVRRRLAIYVVFLLLLPLVGYATEQVVLAVRVRYEVAVTFPATRQSMASWLNRLQGFMKTPRAATLPAERRQWYQEEMQRLRRFLATAHEPGISYPAAILEAVLTPRRETSFARANATGLDVYPSPSELHRYAEWEISGGVTMGIGDWFAVMLPYFTWWLIAFFLMPVGFLCLPVSRRRARVRWRHIVRVGCYGLFIPTVIVTWTAFLFAAAYGWLTHFDLFLQLASVLIWLGFIPVLVVWWALAIGRYLRIAHAWAVAVLLSVMSLLLCLAACWLIAPDVLIDAFW